MRVESKADEFKRELEIKRVDLRGLDEAGLRRRGLVILHKEKSRLEVFLLGEAEALPEHGGGFYVPSTAGKTIKAHGVEVLKPETALVRIRAHKDKCIFVAHENPTVVGELFKNFWDPLVLKQLVSEAVAETQPAVPREYDPFEL